VIALAVMMATLALAGHWAGTKQRRQREAAETAGPDHPEEVRHARDHQ
jgi:hypothetical protein